jgi:hypothetical protein
MKSHTISLQKMITIHVRKLETMLLIATTSKITMPQRIFGL